MPEYAAVVDISFIQTKRRLDGVICELGNHACQTETICMVYALAYL